ncbi:MAG: hypothetical protein NVSMB9_12630 [Isosphaeraceae bacterium]
MRRIALAASALFLWATCEGCRTVGPTVVSAFGQEKKPANSGFSYTGGRAVQTFAQSPKTVQPALVAALDDLRIQSAREFHEEGAVIYEGITADNRNASVTVRPHPAGTRLSTRIGLFGDEPLSRALMDRVGIRLGSLPPSPILAEPPSAPASNPYFSRAGVTDSEMLKDISEAPYR